MKLFISWSGLLSKNIAIEIEQWLKRFFTMDFETFISDNIDAGKAWDFEILSHLKQSHIGLLILTKENFKKPWILYEAGALTISFEHSKVIPLLFDLSKSDVEDPIARFQMVEFNKPSLLKVLQSINNEYGEKKIDRHVLDKNFNAFWNELNENIQKVKQEFSISSTPIVHRNQAELTEEILSLVRDISSRNFAQDFKSKVLQDAMKRHMGTFLQLYNNVKRLNDKALLGYAINLFGTYYKVYDEFDIEDKGKSKALLHQYKTDLVSIYKELTGDDLSFL